MATSPFPAEVPTMIPELLLQIANQQHDDLIADAERRRVVRRLRRRSSSNVNAH
jgi:hypothetical protein